MLTVQTNVPSLLAQENLRVTNDFQSKTIQRLTSGYRINQSGDDAAGLVIANRYRSDVAELTQGVRNAYDGVSALQIIDGGLNNISKMLDRLKTLATQAATGTTTADSITTLNAEYVDLLAEIDRQADNIDLGSTNGTKATSISIYIGGNQPSVVIDLTDLEVDTGGTGLNLQATISAATAQAAITAIETAIQNLGAVQGVVGTGQNKLAYAIELAQSQISSYSAAESRIRDADMAAEAANLTKAQVLQQASLAAMAQANSAPQAVLSLLRG